MPICRNYDSSSGLISLPYDIGFVQGLGAGGRKRTATELEELTQQVAGLPWLDSPSPLQLVNSAFSLSAESPSLTRKLSRLEDRPAPAMEHAPPGPTAVQLTHLQAVVDAECRLLNFKLGPTHVLAMLPQQQNAQDHVIVSFHPAATQSSRLSMEPISASAWQQLLIQVPLGYPQQPPSLLFPMPADFLECCQVRCLSLHMPAHHAADVTA